MESKLKDANFVVLSGWMINSLELKGNELIIYAVIYSFSQEEDCWYTGSQQYLADWIQGTKMTVRTVLTSLMERGYIDKKEEVVNGVKFCRYKASFTPPGKYFAQGANSDDENFAEGAKNLPGDSKNFAEGGQKICPIHNNKEYNKAYIKERGKKVFSKPTIQEIADYCKENNYQVDAEYFFNYYESIGWKVGNHPMKSWRSAAKNWHIREMKKKQPANSNFDNQKDPEGFNELFK